MCVERYVLEGPTSGTFAEYGNYLSIYEEGETLFPATVASSELVCL
jgi:hypothetical protein